MHQRRQTKTAVFVKMELVVINRNDLEQIINETVQSAFERFAENAPAPMVGALFIDKREDARLSEIIMYKKNDRDDLAIARLMLRAFLATLDFLKILILA